MTRTIKLNLTCQKCGAKGSIEFNKLDLKSMLANLKRPGT